jgi:ribosomal protein S18 acetylase RimI-like enzyme
MEIRKATIDDFEQVKDIKLKIKAAEEQYNTSLRPLRENSERYLSYLRNDLSDPDRAVFMATDRDETIGMVTGRIYRTLPIRIRRKEGRISNLFVLPAHRNSGLGTELVRELLEWFRGEGIKDVRLSVHWGNTAGLELYRKLQFEEYLMEFKKTL